MPIIDYRAPDGEALTLFDIPGSDVVVTPTITVVFEPIDIGTLFAALRQLERHDAMLRERATTLPTTRTGE